LGTITVFNPTPLPATGYVTATVPWQAGRHVAAVIVVEATARGATPWYRYLRPILIVLTSILGYFGCNASSHKPAHAGVVQAVLQHHDVDGAGGG
jgi:hypothetical protein